MKYYIVRPNANIYKLPIIILFLFAVSWQLNARSFNCARLRCIIITWQICVPLNVQDKYYVQSIVIAFGSFGRICIPLLSKFTGSFCFWNGHAIGTSSLWNGHALGHCTQSSRPHIKEAIAQSNVGFMSTTFPQQKSSPQRQFHKIICHPLIRGPLLWRPLARVSGHQHHRRCRRRRQQRKTLQRQQKWRLQHLHGQVPSPPQARCLN